MRSSSFLLCTCQVGAEVALKNEVARHWPDSRFSFSRPGFVTFKSGGEEFHVDQLPPLVYARRATVFVEKLIAESREELISALHEKWQASEYQHLHVFPRDLAAGGHRGYQPGRVDEDVTVEQAFLKSALDLAPEVIQIAAPDKLVLNCIRIGEQEWWLGTHRAVDPATRWVGGFWPEAIPAEAPSRAYGKIGEALDWSRLPIAPGDHIADIGCAPGGTSMLLLERGLNVTGIDPAKVAPLVMEKNSYRHLRKRGAEVRIRELRDVRWLAADMNVAPAYTLATIERYATHESITLRGLIMNLKFPEWHLADQVPEYVKQVRAWGFDLVMARQLSHNRQEVCIVATHRNVMKRRRHVARFRRLPTN